MRSKLKGIAPKYIIDILNDISEDMTQETFPEYSGQHNRDLRAIIGISLQQHYSGFLFNVRIPDISLSVRPESIQIYLKYTENENVR